MPLPYYLGPRERATHRHVLGLTGQGKSKLLAHLFVQLHLQGVGVAVVDPHGDLAVDCLRALADHGYFARADAFDRLWYVDFGRRDRFLPFNVLAQPYPDHVVVDALTEVCLRAWPTLAEGAGPTFENILRHAGLALVQAGRVPFTRLADLLTDRAFRDRLLGRVHDPQVHRFFRARYDRWGREAVLIRESTLNRADLLTFSPTLRYSLGQRDNRLDVGALMDRSASLIVNLSRLDEQTQKLLGAFICHGFEVAALARAAVPEERRTPYELIMDEFVMFSSRTGEGLARILSLTRKYGLTLTLAHQTISQLSPRLLGALQNTIPIAFRLGRDDAEWAARRFGRFDPTQIKHVVADPAQQARTHPLFAPLPEQWEQWAGALERLRPGEAFVKAGTQTTKLRTVLPRLHSTREDLTPIIDHYARRLMRPAAEVVPAVDGRAPIAPAPLPRRTRVGEEPRES